MSSRSLWRWPGAADMKTIPGRTMRTNGSLTYRVTYCAVALAIFFLFGVAVGVSEELLYKYMIHHAHEVVTCPVSSDHG
jgi:hypothetical protein